MLLTRPMRGVGSTAERVGAGTCSGLMLCTVTRFNLGAKPLHIAKVPDLVELACCLVIGQVGRVGADAQGLGAGWR